MGKSALGAVNMQFVLKIAHIVLSVTPDRVGPLPNRRPETTMLFDAARRAQKASGGNTGRNALASSRTRYACGLSALTTDEPDMPTRSPKRSRRKPWQSTPALRCSSFSQTPRRRSRPVRSPQPPCARHCTMRAARPPARSRPQGLEEGQRWPCCFLRASLHRRQRNGR